MIDLERDLLGLEVGGRVTKGGICITEGDPQRHTAKQHISEMALGRSVKSGCAAGGSIC